MRKEKLLQKYISKRNGNGSEHDTLNGKVNWYYNKNKGEVRINLTKPLKYYFKLYYKSDRDEIPSGW